MCVCWDTGLLTATKMGQRERFSTAWFILAESARARRCMQWTECNRGFGFQTKVKDHFLKQRRFEHVAILVEKKQVLSATASLIN